MYCGPAPKEKPELVEVLCEHCGLRSGVAPGAKLCPGCGAPLPPEWLHERRNKDFA